MESEYFGLTKIKLTEHEIHHNPDRKMTSNDKQKKPSKCCTNKKAPKQQQSLSSFTITTFSTSAKYSSVYTSILRHLAPGLLG